MTETAPDMDSNSQSDDRNGNMVVVLSLLKLLNMVVLRHIYKRRKCPLEDIIIVS